MKPFTLAVFIALLWATSPACRALPAQKSTRIHGQGCVEPGAEARCVVVKDSVSGKFLYTLLIKGLQPEIGSGIEFTGVPHTGVTTCNQGTAIDVEKWARKDSLKCTSGLSPQKWR